MKKSTRRTPLVVCQEWNSECIVATSVALLAPPATKVTTTTQKKKIDRPLGILPQRAPLPQRAQEFQQRVEALLGLIHVDLVPRTFDHGKARVGNQRAHRDLVGQRRNRAPRRCEDEGRYVDLRQQRRGIRAS